ncbi:MAG: DEAD/DEAH box helicase [Dehalococcoidia bacterium]|nr:DEAD/DEAH box helicase [Dehalococcoidia bacterium]
MSMSSFFNINDFEARLTEFDALRPADRIERNVLDRIQPAHADEWPSQLHPHVRRALVSVGIAQPYQHQADAITKALSGADVVMESPTASGKTLAFSVPMLHALKESPGSHAMMIYPMKALAFDQREQIRQLCKPLGIESWPYDGDTGDEEKRAMRQWPPHILLTNPEYLNMSFLGQREAWDKTQGGHKFLLNLRYVVIDEMHIYRGFFGSNMALLLRRFFRHLNRIGANPQVFLSTATCANPQEHAKSLTGRDVELVSARDVLRPKRHFLFVDPELPDFRHYDILRLRVQNSALAALAEGLQVLVFCPTKRFLEAAFSASKRAATDRGLNPDQLSAFHADLTAERRQKIQEKIKSGDIRVVFTTNALEIGLDVGGLDGVILAGFPSNIMSAWQQIGRAGRGWDKDAFVLFYAMNDPIDRFFVGNLPAFLRKPFDELVVDAGNEELIHKHLPALMEEAGSVQPQEERFLGTPFYDVARHTGGTIPPGYKPQPYLNLRGGVGQSFALKRGNEELGQVSAMRRFREAYIGAVLPFFGQRYHVRSHEEQAVVLEESEQHLRTDPKFYTVINKSEFLDGYSYGDISVYHGSLSIVMNFTGYSLIDESSGAVIREGGDADALFLNKLHSLWIDLPQNSRAMNGIGAVEHMIRVGAMFVIPADRFDTSTYSKTASESSAFWYENYPGGIGVAKKLFSVWNVALEKGMEVAANCGCQTGCQNCIEPAKSWDMSNANINKVKGLELGSELLAAFQKGPDRKFQNGLMVPV